MTINIWNVLAFTKDYVERFSFTGDYGHGLYYTSTILHRDKVRNGNPSKVANANESQNCDKIHYTNQNKN